jgi:hypothetical protein
MYIKRFAAQERGSRHDWMVEGAIAIEGEFTREEWEKIKTQLIAMGLSQRGRRLMEVLLPSRQQCIDAMMEDNRNCNNKATDALRARYAIPDNVTLDHFMNHYEALMGREEKDT